MELEPRSIRGGYQLYVNHARLGSLNRPTFVYDAVGNRTSRTSSGVATTYVYDDANQLATATTAGSTSTYAYGTNGNRTSVVVPPTSDTTAPTVPSGPTAIASASNIVTVSWTASSDDRGVTSYRVYRGGTLVGLVSATVTSFIDRTTAPSTAYSYTIAALDGGGNASAASSAANVTTPSGSTPSDSAAPSTPTALSGTPVASGRIDLAWTAATDNVGVAGYNVYRDGVKINTARVGSLSYSDTGLLGGANHTYAISAVDAAGNESPRSATWSGAARSTAVTTTYSYDAENRLTGLQSGSSVIGVYAYDGAGNRYGKTAAGVTTAYTLDLASRLPQVLAETAGSSVTSYAYARRPLELDKSGTTYWYLSDTLGSVRLVTDSTGAAPATYAYAAFGSTRKSSGTLANEVRFTGQRTDTESGLEFLRARTYDPSTGTFLQRDSWGITATSSQSLDAYLYTANNPINAVDPSGRCTYGGYGGTCSPDQNVGDLGPGSSNYSTASSTAGSTISRSGPGGYSVPINAQTQGPPPTPTFTKPSSTPPQPCDNFVCGFTNKVGDLGGGVGNAYSQTIGNNFVNPVADTLASWGIKYDATLGFCIGGDISYGLPIGWGGQGVGSFCVYAGTNGQLAYGVTYGLGGGPGTKGGHAGLDIGPLFTNASGDPYDQAGPFVNSNGEASDGWVGGFVSGTGGMKACGRGLMYNVSGGWAPGLGASLSSGVTVTKTDIWWSSHGAPPPC